MLGRLKSLFSWLREAIHHWPFWITLAYFFLAFGGVLYISVSHRVTKQEQNIRTMATVRHVQCIGSIQELEKISSHLTGVNNLAKALIKNSVSALASTPPSDPLYPVRVDNLDRLVRAQQQISAITKLDPPTKAQCDERYQDDLKKA